ncbi:MAG TPA: hypothetical protein ENK18_01855 [Deltaproteobacteria bacterium]|nr:hypothetical protein [Deltaproteobacteria bacterium]
MRRWIVFVVIAAGCTSTPTPATAPPLPPTTASSTTTTVTTTTAPPPSTTTTTVDRLAEVEAILLDLERRRLQALYDDDQEAFAELFANDAYLERSLGAFDVVEFTAPPLDPDFRVLRVLADTGECLAAEVIEDYREFTPYPVVTLILVVELRQDGRWGFSYAGTGWLCDGPHPLGS